MDFQGFEITKIKYDKELDYHFVVNRGEVLKKDLLFVIDNRDIEVNILIKVLVFENAKVDLNAVLRIERGARNTNSNLKIKCLLVSDTSFARIIPSLEILEDDVKAGHSATIASFKKDDVEYMRSRGIPTRVAKKLIIEGFLR